MNLQDGVSLSEAFIVTLFSMGIVFLTLIIIYFILTAFKLIFYKEEVNKKKTLQEGATPIGEFNDELIAVIAAAVGAYNEEDTVAVIAGALAAHNESSDKKSEIKNIRRIS